MDELQTAGAAVEAAGTDTDPDAGADITSRTPSDTPIDKAIDALEADMLTGSAGPLVDLPLIHRWTPGLYAREIFMPAGTLVTSKIHKTEHPYVILSGRVSVFIDGVGVEHLTGPHVGITRPGTRRVLYIHEDTRWITFHTCRDGETLDEIEDRIIERRALTSDGKTAGEVYRRLLADAHRHLPDTPAQSQYDYQGAP